MYDSKCYDLAEAFLSEELYTNKFELKSDTKKLAQLIQEVIEIFIEFDAKSRTREVLAPSFTAKPGGRDE